VAFHLLALLLATVPALAAAPPAEDKGMPALVVLVRHAEKAAEPADDPPLTPAGLERARALVPALKDAGVTAIIISDTLRSRATAEPLAQALGLLPIVVGSSGGDAASRAAAVAAEVRRHPDGVVVVVGHSNTIPAIVAALGGPRLPDIPDKEFSQLLLLRPAAGGARLVRARYGAKDPGP
jgi:broad specificity phosphatase PhoE